MKHYFFLLTSLFILSSHAAEFEYNATTLNTIAAQKRPHDEWYNRSSSETKATMDRAYSAMESGLRAGSPYAHFDVADILFGKRSDISYEWARHLARNFTEIEEPSKWYDYTQLGLRLLMNGRLLAQKKIDDDTQSLTLAQRQLELLRDYGHRLDVSDQDAARLSSAFGSLIPFMVATGGAVFYHGSLAPADRQDNIASILLFPVTVGAVVAASIYKYMRHDSKYISQQFDNALAPFIKRDPNFIREPLALLMHTAEKNERSAELLVQLRKQGLLIKRDGTVINEYYQKQN